MEPVMGREVVRSLNYPGDRTDLVGAMVQQPVSDLYMTVVRVEYNPVTDQSTVRFAWSTADDVPEPDPEPAPAPSTLGSRGPRGRVGKGRKR